MLKVKIPTGKVKDTDMDTQGHIFRSFGVDNKLEGDHVVFPFTPAQEEFFDQTAYDACDAAGCEIDGGTFYVVVSATKLKEDVPVGFKDRKESPTTDNQAEIPATKTWEKYTIDHKKLDTGKYRIRCLHFPNNSTVSKNGLTDSERKVWKAEFGTLMVKNVADKLKLAPEIIIKKG